VHELSLPEVSTGLYESKLNAPWARPGLTVRAGVVDRLLDSRAPVTTVVAPAGYGKTTLLSQWFERIPDRTAWVSLDAHDNDPAVLLGYLATALDRIEPINPGIMGSLASPGMFASSRTLPLMASMLSSRRSDSMLFIDHVEAIESQSSADLITELVLHLPPGQRVALASRREPPLPMPRLRAQAAVVEIGVDDLRMDTTEATSLLAAAGVRFSDAEFAILMHHTEGWPVGLYLAALAVMANGPGGPRIPFSGDDRLIADYLQSEILVHLAQSTSSFLRRTSVLDRLSAPLCDAVLGSGESGRILAALEQSNLLLVPLDRNRRWYRYHGLFKDLLAAELERTEPELIPLLHDRAATWMETNGMLDAALDHAQSAGDGERAARLFAMVGQRTYATGRLNTAIRWRGWFHDQGIEHHHPQVAMLGAFSDLLLGRACDAERAAVIARSGSIEGPMPDGSPLEAWVLVLDAALCRRGVAQMRADAERAQALLAPSSPWVGPALFLDGLAHLLDGDYDGAVGVILDRAVDECRRSGGTPTLAAALAERAVLAIERDERADAVALASSALALVDDKHYEDYLTSIVVFAVAARTEHRQGNLERARQCLQRAIRLRPLCTAAFPASAQMLMQLAHAHVDLGDAEGTRAVVRQIRDIARARPALGAIPQQCDEVGTSVDLLSANALHGSSLTVAELRLLPYLVTHFTFPEIGARMYLSRHTVKSQALAIYRKFGVTSRTGAIERARAIGLLAA
jgi:LuxR family transcriptional regulator, maltose regulon positive regulatory protein